MSTEIFDGTPEALKIRLDALIGGGSTINQVIPLSKGSYLIMYT